MHVSRKSLWGRISSLLALAFILALTPGCPTECEGGADCGEVDAGPNRPPDAGPIGGPDAGPDGGGGGYDGGPVTLTGKVTYDFVPAVYSATTRTGSLAFNQTTVKPVRNADVLVRQGSSILATASTDEQGNYQVTFTPGASGALSVIGLAKTHTPVIQVEDNTDGNAIWAISASITPGTRSQNLHATHGWTGSAFDPSRRTAAPFAILDSMYTAAKAFMAVRPVNFPTCKVNWSPNNVPSGDGEKDQGFIGTSHFTGQENEIYILGKAGTDTDEFDSHVIVHEWGHYFEHNLSRADSPGGPHSRGNVLDPRLSFGEGYGNAIAAMVLPESMYADTFWNGSSLAAFGFDAETAPTPTDDPTPGVFSEFSVLRVLYDLFDSGTNESSYDKTAIGLGTIYDVLVDPQKNTEAMTTIGSFITGLKRQPGVNVADVNTLLAHYNMGPMTSDFGDGDTQLRAIYTQVSGLPFSRTVKLNGNYEYNKRQQNQYFVFQGTGGTMTLTSSSVEDVDIYVYRKGEVLAAAESQFGNETITFSSQPDARYILVLTGWGDAAGDYDATVTIRGP